MDNVLIKNGTPNEYTWNLMKKFIKSDEAKPEDYYIHAGLAAGDKIVPNRYMQIMPDLLRVLADDANKGVSFMLNHNWRQLGVQAIPIGKVFYGELQGATQDGETTSLFLAQYIRKSDNLCDGFTNNSIIEKIQDGVLDDTSIAFSTTLESRKCNICGNSYYSANCRHYAGQKYIVNEETNEVKQCIIQWYAPQNILSTNTSLMENSIVFDGAYPNAKTQSSVNGVEAENELYKSIDELALKSLTDEEVIFLGGKNSKIVVKKQSKEAKVVDENANKEQIVKNGSAQDEGIVNEPVLAKDGEIQETVAEPSTQSKENEQQATQPVIEPVVEPVIQSQLSLTPEQEKYLALGQQVEKEAIEEAIQYGIKAEGNSFDKQGWENRLKALSVKDIKAFTEQWKKQSGTSVNIGQVSTFTNNDDEYKLVQDMSWAKTGDY